MAAALRARGARFDARSHALGAVVACVRRSWRVLPISTLPCCPRSRPWAGCGLSDPTAAGGRASAERRRTSADVYTRSRQASKAQAVRFGDWTLPLRFQSTRIRGSLHMRAGASRACRRMRRRLAYYFALRRQPASTALQGKRIQIIAVRWPVALSARWIRGADAEKACRRNDAHIGLASRVGPACLGQPDPTPRCSSSPCRCVGQGRFV